MKRRKREGVIPSFYDQIFLGEFDVVKNEVG
jgi:hypothetical protein